MGNYDIPQSVVHEAYRYVGELEVRVNDVDSCVVNTTSALHRYLEKTVPTLNPQDYKILRGKLELLLSNLDAFEDYKTNHEAALKVLSILDLGHR